MVALTLRLSTSKSLGLPAQPRCCSGGVGLRPVGGVGRSLTGGLGVAGGTLTGVGGNGLAGGLVGGEPVSMEDHCSVLAVFLFGIRMPAQPKGRPTAPEAGGGPSHVGAGWSGRRAEWWTCG